MSIKKIYLLIGLTTASITLTGVSSQAQTTESSDKNTLIVTENLEKIEPSFDRADVNATDLMAQFSTPQNGTTQTAPLDNTVPSNGTTTPLDNTVPSDRPVAPSDGNAPTNQPTPLDGTIPRDSTTPSNSPPTTPSTQTPPSDGTNRPFGGVNPGRATRSGSSYVGVGGNIGIGGDTGIGEGSFSVLSKVGLTRNLSVRPSVLLGDNVSILLPVTVDFPAESLEITRFNIAPYIGGGAVISTGDNTDVGVLLTGGLDIPINSQFTATAGVNVGFVDGTDVGVVLGVGYNFSGL